MSLVTLMATLSHKYQRGQEIMKSKNSTKKVLALIAACALVFGACGSEDEAAEVTEAPAPEVALASEECAIPVSEEAVSVDVMGWEFPIITQYAAELKECEAANYTFNIQFLDSAEAQNQINLDLATGTPSFEMVQGSNQFIVELAQKGLLLPLNDLIDKYRDQYGLDKIPQGMWDLVTVDGNIYSVPMVANTQHVFYNEEILTKLGLTVPTTYEEAIAMCPKLIEGKYAGFQMMLSADWAWQIEYDNVLGSMGVKPIDNTTGQPNFNSAEGVKAAQILADLASKCGGKTMGTYSTDDVQNAFQTGEYAIGHLWASRAASMDNAEATKAEVLGKIQFAPALTAGTILGAPAYVDGYAIPAKGTVDAEKIFLAILAASDDESQAAAAKFGGVTRDGVSNPEGPRNGAALSVSTSKGRGPDQTHPAAGIYRAEIGKALIKILDGVSAADAIAAAEAAYIKEATAQKLRS
jgi:multiple sugar transport system substrate-binding protein